MSERRAALIALAASTVGFSFCFAAWVLNSVLVTHLVSTGTFGFSETQLGWLLAAPILTGALSRVPLGILTDRYGGRAVFALLMAGVSVPLYLLAFAGSFAEFFLLSLAFGCAGGSFAVGMGYVSAWFPKHSQGRALGVFGIGSGGAAATTIVAPHLLQWATGQGSEPEAWRLLPQIYAGLSLASAAVFYLVAPPSPSTRSPPLHKPFAPLRDLVVWRLGFYFFLVAGSFVALAQWLMPYAVNVYELPLAHAGLLAAAFSLPSGLISVVGGWMSDRCGARTVMNGVFWSSALLCLLLAIPKMDSILPGPGVTATEAGSVTAVANDHIVVEEKRYSLIPRPARALADADDGSVLLPQHTSWQEPIVQVGEAVSKNALLARGVTNVYYPANLGVFALLVILFGLASGIGEGGAYRMIPEQFPGSVGTVGGMVGLIGALGGFILPMAFAYLLDWTGVWASCWTVLALLSLACLVWMHGVFRRFMRAEAPDLLALLERRPMLVDTAGQHRRHHPRLTARLHHNVPLFRDLSEQALERLAEIGEERAMPAQFELFREGDPGDALYCILDGKVSLRVQNEVGETVEIGIRQAGDAIGELALIDGGPRLATVTTLEPCRLFVIERRAFLHLLGKSPDLLANLLVVLTTKIRHDTALGLEQASRSH